MQELYDLPLQEFLEWREHKARHRTGDEITHLYLAQLCWILAVANHSGKGRVPKFDDFVIDVTEFYDQAQKEASLPPIDPAVLERNRAFAASFPKVSGGGSNP